MTVKTLIYRRRSVDSGPTTDENIGYIDDDGFIYRTGWTAAAPVGRVDSDLHVFRTTLHGERELGQALPTGAIRSAGLLEGGDVGWMDPDGVVIQGGMILGEEEVGRVEGPMALAGAAALLLLLLPDEAESDRKAAR